MPEDLITTAEAARIYKAITGRRICRKYLEEQICIFRHLGCFGLVGNGAIPKLTGVRRHAWEYFIKTRMTLNGINQIFHDHEK